MDAESALQMIAKPVSICLIFESSPIVEEFQSLVPYPATGLTLCPLTHCGLTGGPTGGPTGRLTGSFSADFGLWCPFWLVSLLISRISI